MTDITLTQATDSQNPFDEIRHLDDQGGEFWMARELMALLGYARWNEFAKVVRRSSISCGNSGNPVPEHFSGTTRRIESRAGRVAEDWRLSRFACYLIAQNGDPEKLEIAQAQAYFALKTREAETIIPAQSEAIKELELRVRLEEQISRNIQLKNSMIAMHGIELGLTIIGKEDRVVEVEKISTEIVQPATGRCDRILTAEQLLKEIRRKTGQNPKNMKQFTDKLKANGRDDLLRPVTRHSISEYVDPDRLDEAIAVVYGKQRQGLIQPVDGMLA
jgi:hypothetical protein